jgi:hypothetical protein
MLIAGMLEPKPVNHNVGDYWYCYANRDLYELKSFVLGSQWMLLPSGTFVSPAPPPVLALPHLPPRPLWIKHGDLNRIPHLYDLQAQYWIPIVPMGFKFPPLNPIIGAQWFNSNTMYTYQYNGAKWIDITPPSPVGSQGATGQQTVHHAPIQGQLNIKPITLPPTNVQAGTPKTQPDMKPKYSDYDRAMKGIK